MAHLGDRSAKWPKGERERGTAPKVPAGPALTLEALLTTLREVQGAEQTPTGDRYSLKPLTFGGDSDVEQFIREFKDVATLTEWPAPVSVLQLRPV